MSKNRILKLVEKALFYSIMINGLYLISLSLCQTITTYNSQKINQSQLELKIREAREKIGIREDIQIDVIRGGDKSNSEIISKKNMS